jgi:MarR family transcriptional regulator, lower aerobic nicotinate degradation pathway regulator
MKKANPSASKYDFSAQVGHLLRRAYQRHTALFQRFIPDSQLTVAQFVVLCALRDHGGSSMTDLVRVTVIDQATIRGVIDRLRTRGLVQVEPDPTDGRKVVLTLTPAGTQVVAGTVPSAQTITEQTFGPLNAAERVALLFLLQKMCDAEIASPAPDGETANI